ncbi:MAG: RNA methyltransferase [Christensenellaceae bacterium]|nr:RNA methyltransferase [Christensenellaceae bacterium]
MKTITSTQNSYIKELRSLKNKKGRKGGLFLCEGEKCAMEALIYADTEALIITEGHEDIAQYAEDKGIDVYLVSDSVMESVSDTKSQQGIIAVVRKKEHALPCPSGLFVALEDVADPQNVGTIIRTADAAGAACILLSSKCADYTSPKAVRAAMGSIFHLPIVICNNLLDVLKQFKDAGMAIVGTHLKGREQLTKNKNAVIIIGSEARGMSAEASEICSQLYKIPMRGKAESLNAAVAAGIVIYKIAD